MIESVRLEFAQGLNVITGETGAGKSVLAQALMLLVGAKPKSDLIRPGSSEAYVEGIFELPPELADSQLVSDLRGDDATASRELILARRISSSGRSRAYVDGRASSLPQLTSLGELLLAFCGQHEQKYLKSSAYQLKTVDNFCGQNQLRQLAEYRLNYSELRRLNSRYSELREAATLSERELELMQFELDEIDQISPRVDEEDGLLAERARLLHVEKLRHGALSAAESLSAESGEVGVSGLIAEASISLRAASGIDSELDGRIERYNALLEEIEGLARSFRSYESTLEGDSERLAEIEGRLEELTKLKRKHGDSLQLVLETRARIAAELDQFKSSEGNLDGLNMEIERVQEQVASEAVALRSNRVKASKAFAKAVTAELADLGIAAAGFEVGVQPLSSGELGPSGGDQVAFQLAANPGVPSAPLSAVASGGELSRVMLAVMSVAQAADRGDLLIFDEIDAGVGGTTTKSVGEKLKELSQSAQLICITHLPQIAALADCHFAIDKETASQLATTTVARLEGDQIVGELCRMLGADSDDSHAKRHAQELLAA